ncbi:MetQ/NlpA family ABC transporter substrate-binding protein [Bifidobacterium crudilactis]|jgi:D-methionine transport system substrate-binding protein|uniref:MetQ/NlpA family ABC transporter substrate-binding protein n=1 Tax=Bifidobacterium crudilactis TaxID=327277 RepID=UPI0023574B53|nr:MetQ/NlpA family ABC transporter substrate-binding protein [Bifidobacterium crudilactis]MCI2148161.1 MetQ/NlpA family ABC transporter substrate-binding protein [Bifidobacterium crudilactis]MCI2157157.1 MetQ/NlpA family ABC transporter substrate-binding protein [Bifidobacterium crudilactis]
MATTNRAKAKRTLIIVLAAIAVVIVVIAGFVIRQNAQSAGETVVKVGLVGNSDDNVWKAVQAQLDKDNANIKLEYKTFQDGIYTNQALSNNELDITAFQHYAFLNQEIKDKGYKFTVIGDSYISPFNLYSDKYKNVSEFKSGDKVAIPNNATNLGRALKVLDSAGLITLKDSSAANPTVDDIAGNPSGIDIVPNDAASIINLLPDYAGGITNTNFIIDAGKSPDDAIYAPKIDADSTSFKPYVNVIVANTSQKDNETYKKVVAAYHTDAVATQIKKNHNIPFFD